MGGGGVPGLSSSIVSSLCCCCLLRRSGRSPNLTTTPFLFGAYPLTIYRASVPFATHGRTKGGPIDGGHFRSIKTTFTPLQKTIRRPTNQCSRSHPAAPHPRGVLAYFHNPLPAMAFSGCSACLPALRAVLARIRLGRRPSLQNALKIEHTSIPAGATAAVAPDCGGGSSGGPCSLIPPIHCHAIPPAAPAPLYCCSASLSLFLYV